MGLELHRLGCTQTIAQISEPRAGAPGHRPGSLIATRAYFPNAFRAAVRQRSRWMTGIALQSWQKFGWQVRRWQAYWLWRDRKGLLNHPVAVLVNVLFLYGCTGWLWSAASGNLWPMRSEIAAKPWLLHLLAANAALLVWRQTATAMCVGRIYGWPLAMTATLRAPWANLINCCASFQALGIFLTAQLRKHDVRWRKTLHAYPTVRQRSTPKVRLGAILVSQRAAQPSQVQAALQSRKWGERLGESLVRTRVVSEQKVYEALSLQHGLPFLSLEIDDVDRRALESLPRTVTGALGVIPFLWDAPERLWLAVCEAPEEEVSRTLSRLRNLQVRFALITPANYRALEQGVLRLEHKRQDAPVSIRVTRAREEVYQAW
jgi:adsorption protein B